VLFDPTLAFWRHCSSSCVRGYASCTIGISSRCTIQFFFDKGIELQPEQTLITSVWCLFYVTLQTPRHTLRHSFISSDGGVTHPDRVMAMASPLDMPAFPPLVISARHDRHSSSGWVEWRLSNLLFGRATTNGVYCTIG